MKRLMDLAVLCAPMCLMAACTGQLDATEAPEPGLRETPGSAFELRGGRPANGDPYWRPGRPMPVEADAGEMDYADAGVPVEPAPEPEPAPAPAPAPAPTTGIGSLGTLPTEMAGLQWPAAPVITRTVTVTSAAAAEAEAGTPGTRIEIRGAVGGSVRVTANDIEIVADGATRLGGLSVAQGVHRVKVSGGQWSNVRLTAPASYYPTREYRSEWMVEDFLIQDAIIDSSGMAFEIRGRRIALLRNDVTAGLYSVWCGDTGPLQSEDVILHENSFDSAGPESTVRLVQVLRSAAIGNTFHNPNKHNYRIHGVSDLNYAADNLLLASGVMMGTMPGDSLGRVWFDRNVFHHYTADLFNMAASISMVHAHTNTVYSDVWSSFPVRSSTWDFADNTMLPYRAPPAP